MSAIQDARDQLWQERVRLVARVLYIEEAVKSLDVLIRLDGNSADPPEVNAPDEPKRAQTSSGKATGQPTPARRAYSDDEKAQAVRLFQRSGMRGVEEQFGISSRPMINRWRREGRGVDEPGRTPPAPAAPIDVPVTRKPNPIDKSPTAGKGAFVPSGIKAAVDEDAARRAAFADPEMIG